MYKKLLRPFFFTIIVVCICYSCRKEKQDISWDTDVLAPLIKSTLGLDNIIADSLIQQNPDSSLKVVYQNNLYNLKLDSLFKVPNTDTFVFFPPFALVIPFWIDSAQSILSTTGEFENKLGNTKLSYTQIKSGYIKIAAKNDFKRNLIFKYELPKTKIGASTFTVSGIIPAATAGGPGTFSQLYSLAGYEIDLTGLSGTHFNTVVASVSLVTSDSITIYPGDSAIVWNGVVDLVPSYARGYLGSDTLHIGPEEISFGLFDKIKSGVLSFENASMKLNIGNSIGIDARAIVENVYSKNTRTNTSVNLTAPSLIKSPVNLNRATETGNIFNPVIPYWWSKTLDNSNSNIKSLVECLPDKIGYELTIITNPIGNVSGGNDFIYSDYTFTASLDVEIPLFLSTADLTLADTVDFKLKENDISKNINNGTFILYANNGFPFDAQVQMYMLSETGAIIDSLFLYPNTVASAPVDGAFKVTSKKMSKLLIPVDPVKLNKLYSTNRMKIVAVFNTVVYPNYLKIYSYYTIDFSLVGDFTYRASTK